MVVVLPVVLLLLVITAIDALETRARHSFSLMTKLRLARSLTGDGTASVRSGIRGLL